MAFHFKHTEQTKQWKGRNDGKKPDRDKETDCSGGYSDKQEDKTRIA
jgi:hypothetical protein